GFLVATMDAPSNRKKMNAIWRMSNEHAEDISAVAKYLKEKSDVPVWIIGTSMGSFSAANAGIRLNNLIDGIVLTSSITNSKSKWKIYDKYPNGIMNMDLEKVQKPVLIISHQDDKCALTPALNTNKLASRFTSSSRVEVEIVTGGDTPRSAPCKALSAHGFLGIENKVVERIGAFIKSK
ncbi:MAG: alpha/beta hydrolase, partial [Anaerolineales bacterium]